MERATIIGETTDGGAHPVSTYIINDNFMVRVPFGKAVNPITNTNWEGTGVEPHVKTTKDEAMDMAYMMALGSLLKKEENEDVNNGLEWTADRLKAKFNPIKLDEKTMKKNMSEFMARENSPMKMATFTTNAKTVPK